MSLNKLMSILLVAMCVSSHSYADNRGCLKIIFTNKEAVPVTQVVAARSQQIIPIYQLTFIDPNLTNVFANYTVLNFQKAYPIADSFPDDQAPAVRLRLVYNVIIDTTTGKSYDRLKKDIDATHSTYVDTAIVAHSAVNLATPNDYYNHVPGYPDPQLQLNLINAIGAWNITTGLNCIKIGIVEPFGQFQHHEDLDSKIIATSRTASLISADNSDSHATLVAGAAGAATNNGIGVSSLGYNVSLQCYSVVPWDPYGGIVDAIYDKCKVINCSWADNFSSSYSPPSKYIQDILNLAALNNVTIVAAAGNGTDSPSGNQPDYYDYPASYDGVISVTSVGSVYSVGDAGNYNWKDCHRQWFDASDASHYNRFHNNNDRVDICAPGYSVTSTWNLGTSTTTTSDEKYIGNGYAAEGGTSFASPQVAAAAALLYSVNPFFTPAQIEKYLKNNATNIYGVYDNNTWAGKLGAGRLNAGASLQAAASNTYNGPSYCSGNAINCPTQTTSITTTAILSQSKYFYNKDISAGTGGSGYVQTSTTAEVAFIATNSISLEAGFDANPGSGAYFTAYIEPCSGPVGGKTANETKPSLRTDSVSKGLQLYPNPATDKVNIFFTIAKGEIAAIKVMNGVGVAVKTKLVSASENGSGNTVIDVKDLSAGIYYILLTSPTGKLTKKLVKVNQ